MILIKQFFDVHCVCLFFKFISNSCYLYSRIKNTFDDVYLLNIVQKIFQSFIFIFDFCFVCMRRFVHSFNFKCIRETSIHNCNLCVDMKCNCCLICAVFIYKYLHSLNVVLASDEVYLYMVLATNPSIQSVDGAKSPHIQHNVQLFCL